MMELLRLYTETINMVKSKFTRGELSMMLDVSNSLYATPGTLACSIKANVEDAFDDMPGEYEKKWNIAKDVMLKKIDSLDGFELGALQIWACDFWHTGAYERGENPVSEYVKASVQIIPELQAVYQALESAAKMLLQSKDSFKSSLAAKSRAEIEKASGIVKRIVE
jgi:hypothetical protein